MPAPATEDKPPSSPSVALPDSFGTVATGRFLSNTAFRLVYPVLPRIAAGLGVSLGTMGTALAVRELSTLASPLIGRGVDRMGHPRAMTLGLTGLAAGLLLGGVSSGLWVFAASLVVVTIAKAAYDVGSGAWIGEGVRFEQRGRAFGLMETTWALSFIVAMPLAGLAMRAGTWRTPFLVAAALCLAFAVTMPGRVRPTATHHPRLTPITWTPALRAAMAAMVLLGVGHQMLVVTFAAFLEDSHGVSVTGLGLTAIGLGAAELVGSGAAARFSDALGQARGVEIALGLAIPATLLLPLGTHGLLLALGLIAVWFALAEFAIVSMLSLFSELARNARATALGLALGSWGAGHAVGALAGSRLFDAHGLPVTSVAMAVAFAGCVAVVHLGVAEPSDGSVS